MKALLCKDFAALRKSLMLLVLLVVAMVIYSFWQRTVLILPLIFMLLPVILLGLLFSSDAKSSAGEKLTSESIKRRTVVLSRYVFVWIIAIIGVLFALILKFLMKDALSDVPWYLIVPTMLLIVTILSLIQLPLMYKYGFEKVKTVFAFVYFVVFALFFYVGGNEGLLSEFLNKIKSFNLGIMSLILAGVTILLNGASFALSANIYEKNSKIDV